MIERVREFIRERFADSRRSISLLEADQYGYTWEEYERLKLRGSPQFVDARGGAENRRAAEPRHRSRLAKRFRFGPVARLRLREPAAGFTRLGRLIDRELSQQHRLARHPAAQSESQEMRCDTRSKNCRREGRPVRMLDIASGAGRYVLETMRALPDIPISARCATTNKRTSMPRAPSPRSSGLTNVTVAQGDAFDRAVARRDSRRARRSAIVSGLYELFPSNDAVLESLGGLADAVEPGGYLIYTNQPWHPQVEFIARVLRNREGKPWIMRRRTRRRWTNWCGRRVSRNARWRSIGGECLPSRSRGALSPENAHLGFPSEKRSLPRSGCRSSSWSFTGPATGSRPGAMTSGSSISPGSAPSRSCRS